MRFFRWPMGFTSAGAEMTNGYSDETSGSSGGSNGGQGSSGNGGSGGGSSGGSGSGDGRGSQFTITRSQLKDDYGMNDDVVDTFAQNAVLNGYLSDYMNAAAKAGHEASGSNKPFIPVHRDGFVFKGPNDPRSSTILGRAYRIDGKPEGDYHFFKKEFQKMAEHLKLHFQIADQTVEVVVHSRLALAGDPFEEEKFKRDLRTHAVEYNLNKETVPQYVADAHAKLANIYEIKVSALRDTNACTSKNS